MKVFNRASRSEALLKMSLFTESDSFFVLFRRFKGSVFKLVFEIEILDDFRDIALDLGREKGGSKTRAVREETDALVCQIAGRDVGQQRCQGRVDTGGIHVTSIGRANQRGVESGSGLYFGGSDEGLFKVLVGKGGFIRKRLEVFRKFER